MIELISYRQYFSVLLYFGQDSSDILDQLDMMRHEVNLVTHMTHQSYVPAQAVDTATDDGEADGDASEPNRDNQQR